MYLKLSESNLGHLAVSSLSSAQDKNENHRDFDAPTRESQSLLFSKNDAYVSDDVETNSRAMKLEPGATRRGIKTLQQKQQKKIKNPKDSSRIEASNTLHSQENKKNFFKKNIVSGDLDKRVSETIDNSGESGVVVDSDLSSLEQRAEFDQEKEETSDQNTNKEQLELLEYLYHKKNDSKEQKSKRNGENSTLGQRADRSTEQTQLEDDVTQTGDDFQKKEISSVTISRKAGSNYDTSYVSVDNPTFDSNSKIGEEKEEMGRNAESQLILDETPISFRNDAFHEKDILENPQIESRIKEQDKNHFSEMFEMEKNKIPESLEVENTNKDELVLSTIAQEKSLDSESIEIAGDDEKSRMNEIMDNPSDAENFRNLKKEQENEKNGKNNLNLIEHPIPEEQDKGDDGIVLNKEDGPNEVYEMSRKAAPATVDGKMNTSSDSYVAKEKYARLVKLTETLKKKLDRVQAENVQLEEMLAAADVAQKGGSGEIARLESELKAEKQMRENEIYQMKSKSVEKDKEIESLKSRLLEIQNHNETLDEQVKSLKDQLMLSQEQYDTSHREIIGTLRREVEYTESKLELERNAHMETQKLAAERERTLDANVAEAVASLTSMQKLVDEKAAKIEAAEQTIIELEKEVCLLRRTRTESDRKTNDPESDFVAGTSTGRENDVGEIQTNYLRHDDELQELLQESQKNEHLAKLEVSILQQEVTKLRDENEIVISKLKDMESKNLSVSELQRQIQDANDTLYLKQNQLEKVQAEKAALALQLESLKIDFGDSKNASFPFRKALPGASDSSTRTETLKRRSAAVDRTFGGETDFYIDDNISGTTSDRIKLFGEGDTVVPMKSIGGAYARLANAPGRLGGAFKNSGDFLDSIASQIVWVLRRHPLARLFVFGYIILMHLFIYILLHKLQHTALMHSAASETGNHMSMVEGVDLKGNISNN